MIINRFWKRLQENAHIARKNFQIIAWGGSLISPQHAEIKAHEKLKQISEKLADSPENWDYGYFHRDIREPIIKEHLNDDDKQEWVITRNRYGALILNCPQAMFVDIDFVPSGCLFFGGKKKTDLIEDIKDVLDNIRLKASIYETAGGYRLLILNRLFDPDSSESQNILEYFKSDNLYAQLCHAQQCYRARLSPKPYRINVDTPEISVLNINDSTTQNWVSHYEDQSQNFAVCRKIEDYGRGDIHEKIKPIQKIHDDYCLKNNASLA